MQRFSGKSSGETTEQKIKKLPSAPSGGRVVGVFPSLLVLWILLSTSVCAMQPASWEHRLQGRALVFMGERHDNPEHHRLRWQVLRRALEAGWRPAIVMEQLDQNRQMQIDQARQARPRDAQYLIDQATQGAPGWDWDDYRPFIALALDYDLPLMGANLSNPEASKVVRLGFEAVFDTKTQQALGLFRPMDAAWQAAQAQEIQWGHCNALPERLIPAMVRAQSARDALMASIVLKVADQGVVLIAGNGHVRKDLGVPRWLDESLKSRLLTVGYLEEEDKGSMALAFDEAVVTVSAVREDPCKAFLKKHPPAPG
jgi:uncharacterized iron-regulated protein